MVTHHTESLREQVGLMESLNSGGLKLSEMGSEKLLELAATLEKAKVEQNTRLQTLDPTVRHRDEMNRPQVLWDVFHKHFGADYFLEVIADEYGMQPGTNALLKQQIDEHFEEQLPAYRDEQARVAARFEERILILQTEVEALREENAKLLRRHDQDSVTEMKEKMKRQFDERLAREAETLRKHFMAKIKLAQDRVQDMVNAPIARVEGKAGVLVRTQMTYYFRKLKLQAAIKRLVTNMGLPNREAEVSKLLQICEKQLIAQKARETEAPECLVREQHLLDKILKSKMQKREVESDRGWHEARGDYLAMRVEELCSEVQRLSQNKTEQDLHVQAMEKQCEKYAMVLRMKHEESRALDARVKSIERRWDKQAKAPHKFTAKPIVEALRLKSLNELSMHHIRAIQSADLGTQF